MSRVSDFREHSGEASKTPAALNIRPSRVSVFKGLNLVPTSPASPDLLHFTVRENPLFLVHLSTKRNSLNIRTVKIKL